MPCLRCNTAHLSTRTQAHFARVPLMMLTIVQFYDGMQPEEVTEEFLWSRLVPVIGHLTGAEQATLRQALGVARRAHEGQFRKSGEPFITHPVEVTRILGDIQAELVRTLWQCVAHAIERLTEGPCCPLLRCLRAQQSAWLCVSTTARVACAALAR